MIKTLSTKLDVWNNRMLQLMRDGTVQTDTEWCEKIGIQQGNISKVRQGLRGFTVPQLINAARLHNTTLDYICGLTDIKAKPENELSAVEMIEEGLQLLKQQNLKPKTKK